MSDMKKIYSTKNPLEARLIEITLKDENIQTSVQNESAFNSIGEPLEVWINNPRDEQRAIEIVNDIIDSDPVHTKKAKDSKSYAGKVFLRGFMTGAMAVFIVLSLYQKIVTDDDVIDNWDTNGDGAADVWAEYVDGVMVKEIRDTNFDGARDAWYYYSNDGILMRGELDLNHDGKVDFWEHYENNQLSSYSADNDSDDQIDEWGVVDSGQIKERSWSFNNDSIIDKLASYKNGRRFQETYDRDRDGEFDEIIILDEFERVIDVKD